MSPISLENKFKITASTLLAVAAFYSIEYTVSRYYLLPEYERIEQQLLEREYELVHNAITRELEYLDNFTSNWAIWDQSYTFVTDQNIDFIHTNLVWGSDRGIGQIDYLAFYDNRGIAAWQEARDYPPLHANYEAVFNSKTGVFPRLLSKKSNKFHVTGIIPTNESELLLSGYPILPSSGVGEPAGFLVMAIALSPLKLKSLADQTGKSFKLSRVNQASLPHTTQKLKISKKTTHSLIPAPLYLTVYSERSVSSYAEKLAQWMSIALVLFSLLFILTIYFFVYTRITTLNVINTKITRLVERRTAQLKEQTQKAKEASEREHQANKSKRLFLANMSHEVRTPMNAILNLCSLCLQTKLEPTQLDYLQKIRRSSALLLNIVNDMLDYSKIESGKLTITTEEFDIDEVLEQVAMLDVMRKKHTAVELIFNQHPDVPLQIIGDKLRLTQILNNLVGNALKFTESGHILLEISHCSDRCGISDEDVWLEFKVSDTGIGIPQQVIDKLFNVFIQADADTTRKYGGAGLGLVICRELARMMGGDIRLVSNFGLGTTVTVKLPFTTNPNPTPVSKQPQPLPPLLVISANPILKSAIENLLRSRQWPIAHHDLTASLTSVTLPCQVLVDESVTKADFLSWYRRLNQITQKQVNCYWTSNTPGIPPPLQNIVNETIPKPLYFSKIREHLFQCDYDTHVRRSDRIPGHLSEKLSLLSILVVDDDEINIQILQELVGQYCRNFYTANNGLEAMLQVDAHPVDLILLDIQMPVMDGIEATRMLRVNRKFKETTIIALSASAMPEDKAQALSTGMNDFLTKPIQAGLLYQTLSKWINLLPRQTIGADIETAANTGANYQRATQQTEVLNVQRGLHNCMDNDALYRNLLAKFVLRANELILEFELALTEQKPEEAGKRLHALKGLSGTVGAVLLTASTVALEDEIRTGSQPTEDAIQKLKQAVLETTEMISDLLH